MVDDWDDFFEEDEDPQWVFAAFDKAAKGVTASPECCYPDVPCTSAAPDGNLESVAASPAE